MTSMIPNEEHYIPSPEDVYALRRDLLRLVPPEIATIIIDDARYWPKVTWRAAPNEPRTDHWRASQEDGPQCYLLTPRLSDWIDLGEEPFKTREIRFIITSHDQGWSTDDVHRYTTQYMGSRTWFEAAIVRNFRQDEQEQNYNSDDAETCIKKAINTRGPKITVGHDEIRRSQSLRAEAGQLTTVKNPADNNSDVRHIQRNIRASGADTTHAVFWTDVDPDDGVDERKSIDMTGAGSGIGFVRSLEREDRIAVVARALYVAWMNYVHDIEVELFYSV